MTQLVQTLPISSEALRIDFATAQLFVDEPAVFVTVHGGVTEVDIDFERRIVEGLGMLYTGMTLRFPARLIGCRASVLVLGD